MVGSSDPFRFCGRCPPLTCLTEVPTDVPSPTSPARAWGLGVNGVNGADLWMDSFDSLLLFFFLRRGCIYYSICAYLVKCCHMIIFWIWRMFLKWIQTLPTYRATTIASVGLAWQAVSGTQAIKDMPTIWMGSVALNLDLNKFMQPMFLMNHSNLWMWSDDIIWTSSCSDSRLLQTSLISMYNHTYIYIHMIYIYTHILRPAGRSEQMSWRYNRRFLKITEDPTREDETELPPSVGPPGWDLFFYVWRCGGDVLIMVSILAICMYMYVYTYGGFLKWWCPTMGFPPKNDHLGVFWG